LRRRIGAASGVLGLFFVVLGLVLGLRGAPGASQAPVVIASLVLARALMCLGMLGLGVGLMRFGARLLLDESKR
jgi:hypothetical protein